MEHQILVPLDGSTGAESALAAAIALARATRNHLHLLQVVRQEPAADGGEQFQQAHAYLRSVAWRLRPEFPTIQRTVLAGDPVAAITAFADTHPAVCEIAMATHGWSGGRSGMLGSVAEQVVQHSPVPVLLTRINSRAPLPQTARDLTTLLVPLDGSRLAEEALGFASNLAQQHGAAIVLLAVIGFMDDLGSPGAIPLWALSGAPEVREQAQVYLEATAAILRHEGLKVKTLVVEGSAAPAIVAAGAKAGADMLLMTTHGWSGLRQRWMGTTVASVVRSSSIPVMLFRPFDDLEPQVTIPALVAQTA
ncbi:MAG TPA: universal stress protein [Herpetosiphonaceae bacterium]